MIGKVTLLAADSEHPNKHAFSGVLTYFNAASDHAPGGAKGRKVYIPVDVGEQALPTLIGMGVNVRSSDFSGHDPTLKIGVIEKAYLGEALDDGAVPVHVEGYLYAYDFPDIVVDLVENKDDLGFSYETTDTYASDEGGKLVVSSLVFTGAAILYKNKAAYTNTSLAAETEETMDNEQLKEALKAMGVDVAEMAKLNMSDLMNALAAWEAFKDQFEGDGKYASLSIYLSAAAEKDAKIEELTNKVAALEAALTEKLTAAGDAVAKSDYDALKAQVDEMKAKFDEHETALKAEAQAKEAYARKSVAAPTTLLAKYEINETDDLKAKFEKIDASETDPVKRLAAKMEAEIHSRK